MGLLIRSNDLPEDDQRLSPKLWLKSLSIPSLCHLEDKRVVFNLTADTSSSMRVVARELNHCISEMMETLLGDLTVARKVDLQLVRAGGTAKVLIPATSILDLQVPRLAVGGGTPLAEATGMSLNGINEHIESLRAAEISVVSSIHVIVSDGEANDDRQTIELAKHELRASLGKMTLIPLLTENGNKAALEDLCGCRCLEISETDIPSLFRRLTNAIRVVSTTSPSKITGPSFVRDLMFGGE